ncbi:hypothetical protein K4K56_006927 [Colletotrichum sp. SAR 10_98]|nr:hypothetical protein K4K56_006927 [Colletotrichum sp. SAR 10_98]
MAPHDTDSRTSALGANDYFTGSYGRPSTKPFTTKENDAYPMETHVDIRPTPDSHHGLLSDPTFSSEKGSAKGGGNFIHRVENVRWRPVWLRPVTLSTFLALFIALTIVLPVMLWYSQENDGLVRTRENLVYLWRFGPTAILTIISLFWARVEIQAIRYMPWMAYRRAQEQSKNENIYDLDYTAMLSPAILFQSLKRKHYFVFLICIVSLILKIQIVLAPSLYSLAAIRVSEPAEVQVLNSFNTTAPATTYTEGSAYYTAKALVNFDMRFPFGVNENLAYQTFKFSNGTARGTTSSPLSVDVDGYFSKIECLKMEDYNASTPTVSSFNYHTFNVSLTFPGCDAQVPVISDRILWDKNKTAKGQTTGNWVVTNSVGKPCPNLPQQFNQSLYYAARFGGSTKNASQPDFLNVAAVLCTSTGWVSKVRVVDDGVSPNVTELPNVVKTPVTADLWTMLNSAMPEAGGRWGTTGVGMVAGPVDSLSQFRGESLAVAVNVSNPLLYTNEILQFAVLNMSQALGPLLGHYRLRLDDESQPAVTGTTVDSVSKLVVNQWVCWTMAALFALLSLVVASVLLRHTSRTAVWYRDPATMLGNMIFFKEHPDLADRVAHTAKLHPMECFKVPESDYDINITSWVEETKYYEAVITQQFTCPNGTAAELLNRLDMGVATNRLGVSYMADVFYSPQNTADINMACSLGVNVTDYEYASWRFQTYAWGKFSTEKNGFDYFSMWRCNYTWVEATTQVHLAANDGEYVLDPERPPQADLSTTKPWTPTLDIPHVDQQFINIQVGDAYPQLAVADLLAGWIGEQFKALIEPFGKLPLEALGDAGQDEEILQGLQHNYGLVAAQLVNIENRYNLTSRSRNAAPPDELPTLEAVVSDIGRRRLVQNATVTYILVAILVAVALTHISAVLSVVTKRIVGRNWPFHLDVKGLAPDGFHSMATMGALLRGSNASDHLPESTQFLPTDELHGRLSDLNFRLGWFQRALGQARVFTIGVRGDGDFQYLGGKTAKVDDGGTF